MQADLQEALDLGVTLFAGEAEGRIDTVLRDAAAGTLRPIYNYLADLPALEDAPTPYPAAQRHRPHRQSSRQLRRRARLPVPVHLLHHHQRAGPQVAPPLADDIERLIREHWAEGVRRFFITDDNFARNKDWEAIFDRIIADPRARRSIKIRLIIQVDTLCHKLPNFIEKAARAGVHARVHRAGEHQSRQSAGGEEAAEQDHRIPHDAAGLEAARASSPMPATSWAFPADTPESIRRDIEIIKRELPVDILEFFCLTPLPGSEDHKVLTQQGRLDGPRHEQIRPGACRRGPSANDAGRNGHRIYQERMGDLLHAASTCGRSCGARRVRAWG